MPQYHIYVQPPHSLTAGFYNLYRWQGVELNQATPMDLQEAMRVRGSLQSNASVLPGSRIVILAVVE